MNMIELGLEVDFLPHSKQSAVLMEYITLRLDSTNEVEHCYVRHNYFLLSY